MKNAVKREADELLRGCLQRLVTRVELCVQGGFVLEDRANCLELALRAWRDELLAELPENVAAETRPWLDRYLETEKARVYRDEVEFRERVLALLVGLYVCLRRL